MITVFQSNNIADLAFAKSLLSSNSITFYHLDVHTSMIEGSIGIIPQRIVVADDDADEATQTLRDNGLLNE